MGLVDTLNAVDEAVWRKYETVTQYFHKEFGWDKFDLARKANGAYLAAAVGNGFYEGLEGALGSSSINYATAGILLALPGMVYAINRLALNYEEKEERSSLERLGVAEIPRAHAWRPIFGALLPLLGIAAYFGNDKVPEHLSLSLESYKRIEGLQFICSNLQHFFVFSYFYFTDQVLTPPTKKKSILKTLYEKVAGKFQVSPQPELQPTQRQLSQESSLDIIT